MGLLGGSWVKKIYVWIEVYGMFDELNVFVGLLWDSIDLDVVCVVLFVV